MPESDDAAVPPQGAETPWVAGRAPTDGRPVDADHPRGGDGTTDADGADPRPPRDGGAKRQEASFLRELPVLLLVAFVLAFLLRTFVLQVFFIPSASMEPTLMVDDRMVVEKITYRFREPERGEIVVFEGETESVSDDTGAIGDIVRGVGQFLGVVPASARDFVKRVIGLPGDEILIEEGQVFVNGVPLEEPYKVEEPSDYGPVVVPEDRLFFLGDNRPNSSDSRRGLGMVERDHVVGRAVLILFPFDHAGLLTGVDYDGVPDPAPPPDELVEPDAAAEPGQATDDIASLGPLDVAS